MGTGGGTERKEAGAETFCERNVKAAALQMPEAGAKGQRRGPVSLRRKHPLAPRALSGVASGQPLGPQGLVRNGFLTALGPQDLVRNDLHYHAH